MVTGKGGKGDVHRILLAAGITAGIGLLVLVRWPDLYSAVSQDQKQQTQATHEAAFAPSLPPVDSEKPQRINSREVVNHVEDGSTVLLDARPGLFYQAGHLPGALSLPRESFANDFPKVSFRLRDNSGNRMIVVYCSDRDCEDADFVAVELIKRKITKVFVLEGGWDGWLQEGLPTQGR